jgi:hypothetical protein
MSFSTSYTALPGLPRTASLSPVAGVAPQDAASVAGIMITTEARVVEARNRKEVPAMPGGGGMGGMDY